MTAQPQFRKTMYQALSGGCALPCLTCLVRKGNDGPAAVNCPVLSGYGYWGWPCHPSLAEVDQQGDDT